MPTSSTMVVPLSEIGLSDISLHTYDLAEANLNCAMGLPDAKNLSIEKNLVRLDGIAQDVSRIIFLSHNYGQFLDEPEKYHHSQAYFCVVCMISILKVKYGAEYQPKWKHVTPEIEVPDDFGKSSNDLFIHTIINLEGGTCGSLPVYFAAIARRLEMPISLVKAYRHLFLRWDDPDGRWLNEHGRTAPNESQRFNIEATGPDIHMLPDETYRSEWPRQIPQELIDAGIYLKSLTPAEELSEFLAMRGFCLVSNDRLFEAVGCFKWACQLAPNNYVRQAFLDKLLEFSQKGQNIARSSHYGSPDRPPEPLRWPQWINLNGNRLLIQYPQSCDSKGSSSLDIGRSLTKQSLQMPNGHVGWFFVPQFDVSQPLEAQWVRVGLNEYILVHQQPQGFNSTPDLRQIGQPVVPVESSLFTITQQPSVSQSTLPKMLLHDVENLKRSIQQIKQCENTLTLDHQLLPVQNFKMLFGRSTQLPRLEM